MEFPRTTEEAREHIAQIRRRKGLEGPEDNSRDLEGALKLLSVQLYQKPTRFLLELIQNVDDNTYDSVTPTLHLSYRHGRLRIACNEVGFQKRNVEAICRIGQSTKTANGGGTVRYIGEKGIGFKSVFKVADIAWIQSGTYSFKFDTETKLGMIAPIWEDSFPDSCPKGFSCILLQLKAEYDEKDLLRELRSFDASILLFLRQLQEIRISISSPNGPSYETVFKRADPVMFPDGATTLSSITCNSSSMSYVVTKHLFPAPTMPDSDQRQGRSEAEVVLAFPVTSDGQPAISPQHVFTFLPVRDYGFKFLLQAEFTLTTSREDIDGSSAWNMFLLQVIPDAITAAIHQLNNGMLRHLWPRYLHPRQSLVDNFKEVEEATMRKLSASPILEALSGGLERPSDTLFIPEEFRDDIGVPFTLGASSQHRYLSPKYIIEDLPVLQRLEVQEMTVEMFLQHLQLCLSQDNRYAQDQSRSWHSCVARCLMVIIAKDRSLLRTLKTIPLIPLQDGRWVRPDIGTLLFPSTKTKRAIPPGIEVLEVEGTARDDPDRHHLFVLLGVKVFNADRICEIIASTHADPFFQPSALSRSALVAQVVFVYHSNWKDPQNRQLVFVTEAGTPAQAGDVYVHHHAEFAASGMPREFRDQVSFLHRDYAAHIDIKDHANWVDWLIRAQRVNYLPRLASPNEGCPFAMATEFEYLMSGLSAGRILELLRQNWPHYRTWLEKRPEQDAREEWESSRSALNHKFRRLQVRCRAGVIAQLEETILPTRQVYDNDLIRIQVPYLDVPDPDSSSWTFLRHFGVGTTDMAQIFLKHLIQIRGSNPTTDYMASLYHYLAVHSQGSAAIASLRNAFSTSPLVFVPPRGGDLQGRWVMLSICVWEGNSTLRRTPCLAEVYPKHSDLFRGILQVRDADISTFLNELQQVSDYDEIEYVKGLFLSISRHLQMNPRALSVDKSDDLRRRKIFPVEGSMDTLGSPGTWNLQSADQHSIWFIADRSHLHRSFDGYVPLLAFRVGEIDEMGTLFSSLSLSDRLLSRVATGDTSVGGDPYSNVAYTNQLRQKAGFIASLVPKEPAGQYESILRDLKGIEVFEAKSVVIRWSVRISGGQTVTGEVDAGRVKITGGSGAMEIYLTKSDIQSPYPPPELGEEICKYCGITDVQYAIILQQILTQADPIDIQEMLERRGIAVKELEGVNIDDSVSHKKRTKELRGETDCSERTRRTRRPLHAQSSRQGYGQGVPAAGTRRNLDQDHLSSFIQQVEAAGQAQRVMNRRWEQHPGESLKPLMSQICRLQDMDASIFLPRDKNSMFERGGQMSYDKPVNCVFTRMPTLIADDTPDGTVVYPAVYYSTKGQNHIRIFGKDSDHVDEETKFLGELAVSRMLEMRAGASYTPQKHWTSRLRGRAGHQAFYPDTLDTSTFTFEGTTGQFSKFVSQCRKTKEPRWSPAPTFHIQVITTFAESTSHFLMDGLQVTKARDLHTEAASAGVASAIFILAVVYNLRSSPEIALYVDPWNLVKQDKIHLSNLAHYMAEIKEEPHIRLRESSDELASSRSVRFGTGLSKFVKRLRGTAGPSEVETTTLSRRYDYAPFQHPRQFRLLELHPGRHDSPLEGTVSQFSLDRLAEVEYVALSYEWGADIKPFQVQTSEGLIPITPSLNDALRRIRVEHRTVRVWADAVCINQKDANEKSVQIRLMAEIFRAATHVCAWIGKEKDSSNEAMETLLQIRTVTINPKVWPQELKPVPFSWRGGRVPRESEMEVWQSIEALLDRGWFKRAWIVQEIVLAQKTVLYCGDWSMDWDDFFDALKTCISECPSFAHGKDSKNGTQKSIYPAYVLGLARAAYGDPLRRTRIGFLTLVELFCYTQSSVKLDRLFSLLALASDAQDAIFNPDYNSADETVIRRYASVFVSRGEIAKLLCRAGLEKSYPFCSWIPNWTAEEFPGTISTWHGAKGQFTAAGSAPAHFRLLPHEDGKLSVRAVFVDSITSVGTLTTKDNDLITYVNFLRQNISAILPYPTGESEQDLQLFLPIGGATRPHLDSATDVRPIHRVFRDNSNANESPNDRFDLTAVLSGVTSIKAMFDFLKKPQDFRDNMWRYWHTVAAFSRRLSHAHFCRTKRLYAGLAPGGACVGDRVCIIHGMPAPFLVRECLDGSYKVVGECYIHGIMYGEALGFEGVRELDIVLV
ncbi:hypothetical protein QBC43DRAFT_296909 [Cladorrhinum sp. PSN259]|nr:hypothetical protein QBC43DRAFT_296909 [Cladorrhinum sp. PSN259]